MKCLKLEPYQHNNHITVFRKYYEQEGIKACEMEIKNIKNSHKYPSKQYDYWYNGWMSYNNRNDLEWLNPEDNYCGGY